MLEFRVLNEYVDADTAHADVWGLKLREWRKKGSNVSVLNLRRAYFQVRVYKSLWPYQTVILEGKRYYLSHMGFGLNVALSFMRAIVEAITFERWRSPACNFSILRRCLYQRRYSFRNQDEATFDLLWTGKQGARSAEERCTIAWLNISGIGQNANVVTRERGPWARKVVCWCP